MEIIKPGKIFMYEYSCSHCGCIFRFAKSDDVVTEVPLGHFSYFVIECPCCKAKVSIDLVAFEGYRVEEEDKVSTHDAILSKIRRHFDNIAPNRSRTRCTHLRYWYRKGKVYVFVYSVDDKDTNFCLNEEEGRIWSQFMDGYEVKNDEMA